MLTLLAILAACFGVAMGASPLLQAIRMHQRQSSADISLLFLSVLLAGGLAWLSYGIALGNLAIIVANSVGVLSSTTAITIAFIWRKRAND